MKHYNDPDPLHGNGKAAPKPKRPNPQTHRRPNRVLTSDYIGHPNYRGPCCIKGCRTTRRKEAQTAPAHTDPHAKGADAQE